MQRSPVFGLQRIILNLRHICTHSIRNAVAIEVLSSSSTFWAIPVHCESVVAAVSGCHSPAVLQVQCTIPSSSSHLVPWGGSSWRRLSVGKTSLLLMAPAGKVSKRSCNRGGTGRGRLTTDWRPSRIAAVLWLRLLVLLCSQVSGCCLYLFVDCGH